MRLGWQCDKEAPKEGIWVMQGAAAQARIAGLLLVLNAQNECTPGRMEPSQASIQLTCGYTPKSGCHVRTAGGGSVFKAGVVDLETSGFFATCTNIGQSSASKCAHAKHAHTCTRITR